MAMIKCRECGEEMSDHAKSCPNCGMENSIMFCPECDKQLSSKATVCPSCGYDFKDKVSQNNNEKGENFGMAIAALICSFIFITSLVGLFLGIIVLNSNKWKKSPTKTMGLFAVIISSTCLFLGILLVTIFSPF